MKSYLNLEISKSDLLNVKKIKGNLISGTYKDRNVYVSYNTIIAEKIDFNWFFTESKYTKTTTKHLDIIKVRAYNENN